VWYENIGSALFGFVTKHACDGQTGGQNYDALILAASCGRNATDLEGVDISLLLYK